MLLILFSGMAARIFDVNTTLPFKEISYMLGYNEPSAFVRAFKRWTGQTPAEYVTR